MLALLALAALADPGPFDAHVLEPVPWQISNADHDALLEEAAGMAPADAIDVVVWATGPDGVERPLRDYVYDVPPVPDKETHRRAGPQPVDALGHSDGFLAGKATYLSQCHGFFWSVNLGAFTTQRGVLFDTVEDFHNPEGMNQYLTAYLENAGARVFTARERDMNPLMALADNDGLGYAEVGSGFVDGGDGFADEAPYDHSNNPFRKGSTRRFPADPNNQARWTPQVPADGWYNVYVSWKSEPDNSPNARYQLRHPGGVVDRTFDQRVHGRTWQYVDNLWLTQGESLEVVLTADSVDGNMLSADAVRIGGGMGDIRRAGLVTNEPRWSEAANLYTQYNGAPSTVYDAYGDLKGDPSSRSRWAAWEHPTGEDAVYLSWHSNAGGGTGTSTYTWLADNTAEPPGSTQLGDFVHDEIINAITSQWDADWTDRGRRTAHFSEVSPNHNDEMPSALVELAFHDHEQDTFYLKHPEFRRDASRAMYRGIVRYFADKDGTSPAYLPEPPVDVAIRHHSSGRLEVTWEPGVSGDPFGDAAQGYWLYTSPDGKSWQGGREPIQGTSTIVDTDFGERIYVRVAAFNDGGVSFPSEVVGGMRSGDGTAAVLVVAAFERLETSTLIDRSTRVGTVKSMHLRNMNAFDHTAAHGEAIGAAGWPFDTVSDEVFDDMDISGYRVVVWNAGEESTADETFSDAQQAKLRAFIDGGGALWASGSEILWDLDFRGSADDKAFASDVLGATMASDDSGSDQVDGEDLLGEVGPMDFGFDDGAVYPVEYPDVIGSSRTVVARYGNGDVAGTFGDGVFLLGYPFETIIDASVREQVAAAMLPALVPDYTPPPIPGDTGDSGLTSAGGWRRHPIADIRGCGCNGTGPRGVAIGLLALLFIRRRD